MLISNIIRRSYRGISDGNADGIFVGEKCEHFFRLNVCIGFRCTCESQKSVKKEKVAHRVAHPGGGGMKKGEPIARFPPENAWFGLAEVTLQQTLKGLAVAGLIPGHFMDGIVDGVQIQSLGSLSQIRLAGGSAVFRLYAHLQVLLRGVGDDLAQKLCKFSGMLCFFIGSLFPVQANFRVALAVVQCIIKATVRS